MGSAGTAERSLLTRALRALPQIELFARPDIPFDLCGVEPWKGSTVAKTIRFETIPPTCFVFPTSLVVFWQPAACQRARFLMLTSFLTLRRMLMENVQEHLMG